MASITSSGGSSSSGSLHSSSESSFDGLGENSKRMSVREKRMQLMQSARRSGSLPSSPTFNKYLYNNLYNII